MNKPVIAITVGDFNGIGPEVVLKSVVSSGVQRYCQPLLIGPLDVFQWYTNRLKIELNLQPFDSPTGKAKGKAIQVFDLGIFHSRDIQIGKVTPVAGTAAGLALHKGVELCLKRKAAALVTAPVSKSALSLAGYTYPGQTELLAELTESQYVTMMLVSKELRVGLVTVHVPLREVIVSLSIQKVFSAITVVNHALIHDFGIRKPRVAVLALNPHGGEGGLIGDEDERVVTPAIDLAKTQHVQVLGPFSSDAFFGNRRHEEFDAVVAMYHDQGLIPLKMSSFGRAVNFSAGLKIVRTSPDHGTAFDIAGKGLADPGSMTEAIRLAVEIANRRQTQRLKPARGSRTR
jgi:4-hydroxythreonine-4-phosphate dehydrogenase